MKPIALAALLLGALAISASAQTPEDEPGPGVARLSLVDGDVTVRRGDSGEFVAAERNAPLVALDHVLTGTDGRAEVQFDWANMIRLAPNSELRLAALEEGDFFLQIAEGLATFSVLRESGALVEVSTLAASVRPIEQGNYRVLVRPDGSTQITVRSGEAEVFTTRGSEFLRAGRTMEVRGDPANPDIIVLASIPLDEWDSWNLARDRDLNRSDAYRYVSRDVYGADELDGHGRWVYDSPYGWVWVPNVSRSWAPYRVGRWSWVNYYGWTWISSDPWGWAPYHYGRWYYAPVYGWVWYPGTVTARHIWRPALVTFFGWGSGGVRLNVNIGFGYRNVGWVALAPYEVYRPWYGRGNRTNVTVNNTTVINNTVINNVDITRYRNATVVNGRNAITSVSTEDFGRGRVTASNFVRASNRELARAGEVRGRVPLDPSVESRQFSDRAVDRRNIARREIDDTQLARRGSQNDAARNASAETEPRTGSPLGNRSAAAARANAQTRPGPQNDNASVAGNNGNRGQAQRANADAAATPEVASPGGRSPLGNRSAAAARANTPAPRRTEPAAQPQGSTSNNSAQSNGNRGQAQRTPEVRSEPAPETRSAPAARPAPQPQRAPETRSAPSNESRGGAARSAPAPQADSRGNSGGQSGRAERSAPSDDNARGIPGRGPR